MRRKIFSTNSITGFGAILLSISSFIAQSILEGWTMSLEQWLSPLGIISIILFIGGAFLIIWSFFRRELTFEQKRKIVEDRESYLPQFRDTVDKMLTRLRELAIEAIHTGYQAHYQPQIHRLGKDPYRIRRLSP